VEKRANCTIVRFARVARIREMPDQDFSPSLVRASIARFSFCRALPITRFRRAVAASAAQPFPFWLELTR